MADQPFLVFPRAIAAHRAKLSGRGGKFTKPTPAQQRARLEQKFQQITNSFQGLQATIEGAEPEQVIVLETLTSRVDDVAKAAAKIPGLEWLAEIDLEDAAPAHGFADTKDPSKSVPNRLYALFTNQQAMTSLLALWDAWHADPTKRATTGFGPFKNLFIYLKDIRRWGPQDRIAATGVLEAWQEDVEVKGAQGTSLFEIELWYRSDAAKRQQAVTDVRSRVQAAEGNVIASCVIDEIRYHALLVEVTSAYIQSLLTELGQQQYTQLLNAEGVMYFRPHGQSRISNPTLAELQFDPTQRLQNAPTPTGAAVLAILDGMPLANHVALRDRLVIDDPDNHSALYQVGKHFHGTAISSLVLHGDFNGDGPPQSKPVYVRPIMHPAPLIQEEITPLNQLLVDLVHRAVRRMFEGDGGQNPSAPQVLVVNLSIGDRSRPFDREISPLARLIDWLSWKYRVLFVVSAGNYRDSITLNIAFRDWSGLQPAERAHRILKAMKSSQFRRRPLSPAESINCLTVGSAHKDECAAFEIGPRVNMFDGFAAPSPITTVAVGFRRANKPEVLLGGGKQLFQRPLVDDQNPSEFPQALVAGAPGNFAAVPGVLALELSRFAYSCGTSNSAALATRFAGLAHDVVTSLALPPDADPITREHWAPLLKALIVHGASWGEAGALIETAFADEIQDWQDRVQVTRQFLGYGEVDPERCVSATDQRATILGWGSIRADEGQTFELPLPPSLSAVTEARRLTVTLAWISPCNQKHQDYRKAQLFLKVPSDVIGTSTIDVDAKTAQRGTVEHRIFEGTDAKAFLDGAKLTIQVNCAADAGKLTETIHYAVVASLEVGADSQIAIYDEVRSRIRPQVIIEA